jgi:hypothetical protein
MDGKIYCLERTVLVYVEKQVGYLRRLSSKQEFGWVRNVAEFDGRWPWHDEKGCKREWTTVRRGRCFPPPLSRFKARRGDHDPVSGNHRITFGTSLAESSWASGYNPATAVAVRRSSSTSCRPPRYIFRAFADQFSFSPTSTAHCPALQVLDTARSLQSPSTS